LRAAAAARRHTRARPSTSAAPAQRVVGPSVRLVDFGCHGEEERIEPARRGVAVTDETALDLRCAVGGAPLLRQVPAQIALCIGEPVAKIMVAAQRGELGGYFQISRAGAEQPCHTPRGAEREGACSWMVGFFGDCERLMDQPSSFNMLAAQRPA
jgi:hypothetical protein